MVIEQKVDNIMKLIQKSETEVTQALFYLKKCLCIPIQYEAKYVNVINHFISLIKQLKPVLTDLHISITWLSSAVEKAKNGEGYIIEKNSVDLLTKNCDELNRIVSIISDYQSSVFDELSNVEKNANNVRNILVQLNNDCNDILSDIGFILSEINQTLSQENYYAPDISSGVYRCDPTLLDTNCDNIDDLIDDVKKLYDQVEDEAQRNQDSVEQQNEQTENDHSQMPHDQGETETESKKVKVKKINKVDFSVITGDTVKPGESSAIDIFMYTNSQRSIIDQIIEKSKDKLVEATKTLSKVCVKQGSKVTVVISSEDAIIKDNSETIVWEGEILDFKFIYYVPSEYTKRKIDFSCEILFDGIHISRLYFSIKLNASKTVPIRFVRKDCKKAFVSYSHRDKERVIEQLVAIQNFAPHMRFWMDNQSMNAGDLWRDEIAKAIKKSDVFLLFWSVNSMKSGEVEKEWRYALDLERKKRLKYGARFISPVPLDEPSECPPPKELESLHFGDPSFDISIQDIDKINFLVNKAKHRNIILIGK